MRRWWNHEHDPQAIERDFGPAARGEVAAEDLLVSVDGDPVGLVQRIRWGDWPDYLDEVRPLAEVPGDAISLDYLIGDPWRVGRGLGPAVLAATWTDHPRAPAVVIPVAAANRASWRALEKAGMRRVSAGLLPPDNPIDDGWHYLYRIDRPVPGHRGPGPAGEPAHTDIGTRGRLR